MKKIALGFALASLFAVGCGSKGGVDELSKLKDEACACKDKACGEAVNKKLESAMEKLEKDYGGKQPDEETTKKLMEAVSGAAMCIAKLQ